MMTSEATVKENMSTIPDNFFLSYYYNYFADAIKSFEITQTFSNLDTYSKEVTVNDKEQAFRFYFEAYANSVCHVSPYVIKFLGFRIESQHKYVLYFQMHEYTLKSQLGLIQNVTGTQKTLLALEIAIGLFHIHQKQIIHGNISSSNILLTSQLSTNDSQPYASARICDFSEASFQVLYNSSIKAADRYAAPELISSNERSEKIDVYSYGIILYDLLNGYTGDKHENLHFEENVPHQLKNLIIGCTMTDKFSRFSMTEVCTLLLNEYGWFPGTSKHVLQNYIQSLQACP